jgi:hypothetical protein
MKYLRGLVKIIQVYLSIGVIDEKDESIYHFRLRTCQRCDKLNIDRCQICDCYVHLKAALKSEKCPINKW